jgi:hypothetical protein
MNRFCLLLPVPWIGFLGLATSACGGAGRPLSPVQRQPPIVNTAVFDSDARSEQPECPSVTIPEDSPLLLLPNFTVLYRYLMEDYQWVYGDDRPIGDIPEEQSHRAICAALGVEGPEALSRARDGFQFPAAPLDSECSGDLYLYKVAWFFSRLEDGRIFAARDARPTKRPHQKMAAWRDGRFAIGRFVADWFNCPSDPKQYCVLGHPDRRDVNDPLSSEKFYCESSVNPCAQAGINTEIYALDLQSGEASYLGEFKTSTEPSITTTATSITVTTDRCKTALTVP